MPQRELITATTDDPQKQCEFVGPDGTRCRRVKLSKGHCWTHYQQLQRKRPLTPIRQRVGLVPLPGNIRVDNETFDLLEGRVKSGQARSRYEAARQAIEAGVEVWKNGTKIVLISTSTEALPDDEHRCTFKHKKERCTKLMVAGGYCMGHYKQTRRGHEPTPLRDRGTEPLKALAGNVRIPEAAKHILDKRVKSGKAPSLYEAVRQAIEVGVVAWQQVAEAAAK